MFTVLFHRLLVAFFLATIAGANSVVYANEFANDFPGQGKHSDWSSALPYYNLANKQLTEEHFQDAVDNYLIAISYYKLDADFYSNLGLAYRKLDRYSDAELAFKNATALAPSDWVAWNNLANAYLKQNRLKETIATFERTLKCNPPAVDKIAIQRDIADIQKILRMQEPPPPTAAATPVSKKKGGGTTHSAPSGKKIEPDPLDKPDKPNKDALKQSGWDYIYK